VSDCGGQVAGRVQRLLEAGRRYRDRNGFNRFRLVVASRQSAGPGQAGQVALSHLAGLDDRVHLHVVAASDLPEFLADPGS
jgi:hypothetical protein